jgi:hypothetical protein
MLLGLSVLLGGVAGVRPTPTFAAQATARALLPRIVNGTDTVAYPTTGVLLLYDTIDHSALAGFCSGTLIGDHTFLTAAHCVCPDRANTASACERAGVSDPATLQVFLQHAGFFAVSDVQVDPDYVFTQGGDLAIISLATQVTGIVPSAINTVAQPPPGMPGTIVGFGRTSAVSAGAQDGGIKRQGTVTIAACTPDVGADANVCWLFHGTESNTCEGDSGGPLFIDFGSGALLAGTSSGGESTTCLAPDVGFDTDVFVNRSWIAARAAGDLGGGAAGDITPVGAAGTEVFDAEGALSTAAPTAQFQFSVPAGTRVLRIALNGAFESRQGVRIVENDFDLLIKAGAPPTDTDFDCRDNNPTAFAFCEVQAPPPGTWHVLVERVQGAGTFQVTATSFSSVTAHTCIGDCNQDGAVTVDDLLAAVNIALGKGEAASCPGIDLNGDGQISVDEIVSAVNSALSDCAVR